MRLCSAETSGASRTSRNDACSCRNEASDTATPSAAAASVADRRSCLPRLRAAATAAASGSAAAAANNEANVAPTTFGALVLACAPVPPASSASAAGLASTMRSVAPSAISTASADAWKRLR